jgi:hypothetical protein
MSWVPAAASVLRLLESSWWKVKTVEDIHIALDRDKRATLAAWLNWAELLLDDGGISSIHLMHKHGN